MHWTDEYLNRVAAQVRVKRIRGALTAELRDHLELQRAAYLDGGADAAEAERMALADMGDALLVGGALDAAHRPRTQWAGLLAALALILLSVVLQQLYGPHDIPVQRLLVGTLGCGGLLVLFAVTDYTLWLRAAIPAGAAWLLMWALRMALNQDLFFDLAPGPMLRLPFLLIGFRMLLMPEALSICAPLLTAMLACRLRGRGWAAFAVCLLPPAAATVLAWNYLGTGYSSSAMMLMAATGFGALALAVGRGAFRVRRGVAYAVLGAFAGLAAAFFLRDFAIQLRTPQPRQTELLFPLMRRARLIGPSAALAAAPRDLLRDYLSMYAFAEYAFASVLVFWGWIPCLALVAGVPALLWRMLRRFLRMENRMGAILGAAATLTLIAQTLLYLLHNFTAYTEHLALPLLSYGSVVLALDAAAVGMLLSVLRGADLPEPPPPGRVLAD